MVSKMASRSSGLEFLDDVGEVGRVHLLQQLVRDVQAQAALRVGFQNVAELPGDGVGRNRLLHAADPRARQDALQEPAEDAAHADVDFQHIQVIAAVLAAETAR